MNNSHNNHLVLDESTYLENFPRRHFTIAHNLVGHPLLELDSLLKLAHSLPPYCVEYNAANVQVSQNPTETPMTGLGIEETIRHIDESNSWVVLKYVEHHPEYRQLLLACVHEMLPYSEFCQSGAHQPEAYIFISSPGSITPYHFDDEHNFLLQIRGEKHVHTWPLDQPGGISHRELEAYYAGAHRNIPLPDNIVGDELMYRLTPGDGLHIPVHSGHWVKNGDDVSVSFSVTFRTTKLSREARVHWLNARLRRRGFDPRPYGQSRLIDSGKYWVARAAIAAANRLRRRA